MGNGQHVKQMNIDLNHLKIWGWKWRKRMSSQNLSLFEVDWIASIFTSGRSLGSALPALYTTNGHPLKPQERSPGQLTAVLETIQNTCMCSIEAAAKMWYKIHFMSITGIKETGEKSGNGQIVRQGSIDLNHLKVHLRLKRKMHDLGKTCENLTFCISLHIARNYYMKTKLWTAEWW